MATKKEAKKRPLCGKMSILDSILVSTTNAMFVDFDVFIDSIAEIQWIDGAPSEAIQKEILIEAWNFLGIEERILEEDLWDFYK